MANKVYGICCICGKETELTFEHIPPKASLNQSNLKSYNLWGYIINNDTRYKQFQKGAGLYSLCGSCNNLTGEWYGAAYAEFVTQGMEYYRKNSQGLISVPYTFYPLRVFKQIVSCFASINGHTWCESNPQIKLFLLDPFERSFPIDIDIRMYMQTKWRSKLGSLEAQINPFTGERFMGSEWAFPPFSYICVCDKDYTNFRVLNELYSIMPFLNYGYDEQATLFLNIPRKPCNPIILDFREGVPDLGTFIRESNYKK